MKVTRYALGGISVALDYGAYTNDEISGYRFGYRTTGTVLSFLAAGAVGGPVGVAAGLVVGGAFIAGEYIFDEFAYDEYGVY